MEKEIKTSEEWQAQDPAIQIIDADGWDRSNFLTSWYVEKITKEEFEKRLAASTCITNKSV